MFNYYKFEQVLSALSLLVATLHNNTNPKKVKYYLFSYLSNNSRSASRWVKKERQRRIIQF